MMKELGSSIESLAKRTAALIAAYNAQVDSVVSLTTENGKLAGKIDELNAEIERLNEENKVLKMASAIKGDEENVTESKRRISQLVREIDRCIALLNDWLNERTIYKSQHC